jgi:hypothetical protein
MNWRPRGRVFPSANESLPDWIGGYGALPFGIGVGSAQARVFFSGRDQQGQSRIGACTLDLDRLAVVPGSTTPEPLVTTGPLGSFDESGCSVACVVDFRGELYLYYTGWTLGRTVPFYLAVGLAISRDGGTSFEKASPAPLLDRQATDPFLSASPSVLIENDVWRMWYVSGVGWDRHAYASPRHRYLIRYAESGDGLNWRRDGRVAIDLRLPGEYAIGRPHVVRDGAIYRMWYCYRGSTYRIGYAESTDGLDWTRRDDAAGVMPSGDAWDSQMQAYPMVLRQNERSVMLYNGNGYGASGFGCMTSSHLEGRTGQACSSLPHQSTLAG